jgi:hypothetical protein
VHGSQACSSVPVQQASVTRSLSPGTAPPSLSPSSLCSTRARADHGRS